MVFESVANVAEEIAGGDEIGTIQIARERGLAVSTIFRWMLDGLPGSDGCRVKLEALRRGRKWVTSRAAVRRFFLSLPTNRTPITERPVPIPATRQFGAGNAKAALKERFGI